MAVKKTEEVISIKPIETAKVTVRVRGITPLIMHCWDEKAKLMMLEAQQGKKQGKKKPVRNPVADFIHSMYWLSGKPTITDDMTPDDCEAAFNEAISNGATLRFPRHGVQAGRTGGGVSARMGQESDGTAGRVFHPI